jgi:hypothetical protein
MNQKSDHLQQLTEIKAIMERSSRFISLSGLSGVFAGFCALGGAAAFYVYINQQVGYGYAELAHRFPLEQDLNFFTFCFGDAAITLLLALTFGIFFTTRKAKADGQKIWDKTVLRFLIDLFIPLSDRWYILPDTAVSLRVVWYIAAVYTNILRTGAAQCL